MTIVKNPIPQLVPHPALGVGVVATGATSVVTDICIWFVREPGAWLPSPTWRLLLNALGTPGPAARNALSRLTKAGYLERRTRDGRPGYSMSDAWLAYWEQVPYDRPEPGEFEDQWTLLTISVPESQRSDRHAIRTLLGRHGFASLGNGVWIGSASGLTGMRFLLESGGFGDNFEIFHAEYKGREKLSEFASRYWDLDGIVAAYRDFTSDVMHRLEHGATSGPEAFADFVLTSNAWRRIGYIDPGLPKTVFATNWLKDDARLVRDVLFNRLLEPAKQYVESFNAT